MKTLKTPISYYGGKQKMLNKILPLFPSDYELYCEPFFGGGAVFWKLEHADNNIYEVINDVDNRVINFWTVLRDKPEALARQVKYTLHSRALYYQAKAIFKELDKHSDVVRAWAFWVLTNMSFSHQINAGYGYSRGIKEGKALFNKRLMLEDESVLNRLAEVNIECNDALKVIKAYDFAGAFFYIDPPYFNSDCGHYRGYSEGDFRNLLELLSGIKGRFLLSSYPSEVLNEFVVKNNWKQKLTEKVLNIDGRKMNGMRKKIESLVWNYENN